MAMRDMTSSSDKTYTLEDFVSSKKSDEMTYYNFSILDCSFDNSVEFSIDNIVYDYLDELKDYAELVPLTDAEYYRYRHRPYLLAYYLYGAVELGFIINALNDFIEDYDFDMKEVLIISPENLSDCLGRIYSNNINYLAYNRTDLKNKKKENQAALDAE